MTPSNEEDCPFCRIVRGEDLDALIVRRWLGGSHPMVAFRPLRPVVPGHTLVVPGIHVPDFAADPMVSGLTMAFAAELAAESGQPMNVISSRGRSATQTVFHLHLHLVPRRPGDGLALPWTNQEGSP